MDLNQTIAALSTPPGESGLAVIRVSGPDTLDVISRVFRSSETGGTGDGLEHRRIYHGLIISPEGETIDEAMCSFMRAPDSYTGEDTAELSCHGNMLIVNKTLNNIMTAGARAAEPGEFTRRAFLNGKLDLIQAEAVSDLIHARSELQRGVAQRQLEGELSRRIQHLADETVQLLASVEANIDFIEEDIDLFDRNSSIAQLEKQREILAELLSGAKFSKPFREGFEVVIAGPVNAGKSTLFNKLLGETRAIVTSIPGTTRDVIREPVIFEGLVFVLQDTAGIRSQAADVIETIGLGLAKQATRAADVVLFVLDGAVPLEPDIKDSIRALDPERTVIVISKTDLPQVLSPGETHNLFPDYRLLSVSGLTGEGLEPLKQLMIDVVGREQLSWISRQRVLVNSRLANLLQSADGFARTLIDSLGVDKPLEILAVEMRDLLGAYEEAIGKRYSDQLLDNIFSRFCIGK
jgi:tRNA modification GTPase